MATSGAHKNTDSDTLCEYCGERPGVKLKTEKDGDYWLCFTCEATCPECMEIGTHSHACRLNREEDIEIDHIMDLTFEQSYAYFGEVL